MSQKNRHEVIVGGTGGQGVISIGYALAAAAAQVHQYVTRFPIYMATMRGGPAYCTVIFADEEIPSSILSRSHNAIAMESGSYGRLKKEVKPGGRLFVNSSVLKKIDDPEGKYTLFEIPVTDLAQEMGAPNMANMIITGAYQQITGILSDDLIYSAMTKTIGEGSKAELIKKAYDKGKAYAKEHF